jgi:ABC-type sugar transport system ATPase subunit
LDNNEYLLQVNGVEKSYSGIKVLENICFNLEKGQILGVVGENGAGKSTLMNIVAGVERRDAGGTMQFENKEYNPGNSQDAVERGISFVHQDLNMFRNLTVAENIFITGFPKSRLGSIDYRAMYKRAKDLLSQLDDSIDPHILISELPMGQRQLTEVAKAMGNNSKVIIFDEPTTSLSNKEKEKLFSVIGAFAKNGGTIIYISHILEDVFRLCDDVLVLRNGKSVGQITKDKLVKNEIIKMMVGHSLNNLFPYNTKTVGNEVFRVKGLNEGKILKNINLALCEGEIVGLFGLMGAGRSELARAVYGVDQFESGEVIIYGKKLNSITPKALIKKGVAYLTENRHEEGLLMVKTVKHNLSLAYLDNIKGRLLYLRTKQENIDTDDVIKQYQVKTFDKNYQEVRQLSGGNQQKVVVGKWMMTKPKIFILDEPTRGIDVGAKFEIYTHMNNLAKNNSALLFISSEMEELMGVCDRIMVMCRGEITGELQREDFSQDALLKLAFGGGN